MGSKDTSITNPWDTLPTVTTFDKGGNAKTTVCLDNENNRNDGEIVEIVTSSTSLLIQSLLQQLCMLFEANSERRHKLYLAICDRLYELKLIDGSYNMIEFEPLRGQYQTALYHLFAVAQAANGCDGTLQLPSSLMTEWSRYHKEFEELSFIAAGGFGNVFKALHRLDGIEYAVKKIIVHSGRIKNIMQHLDEVKTLAKLNHTNIVSYKGAWIEPTLPSTLLPSLISPTHSQSKADSFQRKNSIKYKSCVHQSFSMHSQTSFSSTTSTQSPKDLSLQHGKVTNETQLIEENFIQQPVEQVNSNSISFRCDEEYEDDKTESNISNTDYRNFLDEGSNNKMLLPYVPQMDTKYATLYIQMALCEKTLQQWLDERLSETPQSVIIAIVTQILCGLHYIHSRGIVHHDIKPSNIFISTSGQLQIQLGDFGLACPLQKENHHSILGTHMYAAPEQLQGKCNPKSDIYSLGIVLIEVLVRTRTHMERIEIINGLKRGQIPTALAATYPKWAHIVSQLVQEDPEKRPSTSQLLQDLNEDKDVTITRLKNELVEKDDLIKNLQDKVSMLEEQIMKHRTSL